MNWTVSYRGKSGKLEQITVDADSRSAVFDELSKLGISAVRIDEGKSNSKKRATVDSYNASGVFKTIVSLIFVIACAIAGYFWLTGNETSILEGIEKRKSAIKQVIPMLDTGKSIYEDSDEKDHSAFQDKPQSNVLPHKIVVLDANGINTNGATVVTLNSPIVFTPAEQVLASVFMTSLGDMPPPLPDINFKSEADLITIIDKMYVVNEDDDEETADLKETLNTVKKELDKYMRDGGDVNSFLKYYDNLLNEAREEYLLAHQTVAKIVNDDDEDVEFRIEYIKRVNAHLAEKGIGPVKLTKPQLDDLGVTAEDLIETEGNQ